jgi:lysophospholipase II
MLNRLLLVSFCHQIISSRMFHTLRTQGHGTLILEPVKVKHSATILMLHGLGDSARGLIDLIQSEFAPSLPHVKFVLPTAETRPISVNNGYPMPGWYDIASFSSDRSRESYSGIDESAAIIRSIIEDEQNTGISANRILLSGFSQGGAMSLYVGLQFPQTLAGLLIFSGYLPLAEKIRVTDAAKTTPILHFHGDEDRVLPLYFATDAEAHAKQLRLNYRLQIIEGLGHSFFPEEVDMAMSFVHQMLPSV